jgi:hypothetical protein
LALVAALVSWLGGGVVTGRSARVFLYKLAATLAGLAARHRRLAFVAHWLALPYNFLRPLLTTVGRALAFRSAGALIALVVVAWAVAAIWTPVIVARPLTIARTLPRGGALATFVASVGPLAPAKAAAVVTATIATRAIAARATGPAALAKSWAGSRVAAFPAIAVIAALRLLISGGAAAVAAGTGAVAVAALRPVVAVGVWPAGRAASWFIVAGEMLLAHNTSLGY